MTLWKLTPIDLLDPNWEASAHRGPAIVRAPDEAAARAAAAKAFDIATRFPPGTAVRVPPWTRASLVNAEEIDDRRYDADDGNHDHEFNSCKSAHRVHGFFIIPASRLVRLFTTICEFFTTSGSGPLISVNCGTIGHLINQERMFP